MRECSAGKWGGAPKTRDFPWPVFSRILMAATPSLMRLGSFVRQAICGCKDVSGNGEEEKSGNEAEEGRACKLRRAHTIAAGKHTHHCRCS
jgi:hypothetical protein